MTNAGAVHRQVSTGSGWEAVHNVGARDIGLGADGTMSYVTPDGNVYTMTASGAQSANMEDVSRIAVGPGGLAWVVQETGAVFRQTSSGWEQMGGKLARDIAVAPNGDVWTVSQDGLSLRVYRNGNWQPEYYLEGVEAASIAVDSNGNPWFVGSADGLLYSW